MWPYPKLKDNARCKAEKEREACAFDVTQTKTLVLEAGMSASAMIILVKSFTPNKATETVCVQNI